jgi:hypothetical protein
MRVCVVRAPKLVLWLLKGSRLECLCALEIFVKLDPVDTDKWVHFTLYILRERSFGA